MRPPIVRREVDGSIEAAPLRLREGNVPADWIDYNGHMTEHRYLQVFGEATDTLLRQLGMDAAMLARGRSFFTVETHIMHLAEMSLGGAFFVTTQILAADDKRLQVFHRLHRDTDHRLCATAEQMLLHVDTAQHRACAADPAIQAAAAKLTREHRGLPRPAQAGRHVGAPRAAPQ